MNFYKLEPEVAGGWGEDIVADTTVHPPVVSFLHYQLDGWLGDHLLESFPCFVVSDELGAKLAVGGVSGFHLEPAKITKGEGFNQLSSGAELPKFDRLVVTGAPGIDDIGLLSDASLVVSETCLQILSKLGLTHCGGRQGSCRVSGANQAASLRSSASFDVGVSGLRLT